MENSNSSRKWVIDILSIIALAAATTLSLGFFVVLNNYTWLAVALISALVGIHYRKNINRFLVVLVLASILSNVIITIFTGTGGDAGAYIVLFYIANIVNLAKGAFTGFVFIKLYYWLIGDRIPASSNKMVLALILIIAFAGGIFFISNTAKNSNESMGETQKKTKFIDNVVIAVGKNQLTQFNNQELINLGIPSGIYEVNGNQIVNSYGGNINISKENQDVHLIYDGIPSGERCFQFYYVNDPSTYGFKITKIDGVSEQYSETSTNAINNFKDKVCNSGKKTVTIEFIGSINDIITGSKWLTN